MYLRIIVYSLLHKFKESLAELRRGRAKAERLDLISRVLFLYINYMPVYRRHGFKNMRHS